MYITYATLGNLQVQSVNELTKKAQLVCIHVHYVHVKGSVDHYTEVGPVDCSSMINLTF